MTPFEKAIEMFGCCPVVFDGALGTMLQRRAPYGGCPEEVVLANREALAGVHLEYLEAGCDALETDTFGASLLKLAAYGLEGRQEEICRGAVEAARRAVELHRRGAGSLPGGKRRDRRVSVVGSIGPTGNLPSVRGTDEAPPAPGEVEGWFRAQALHLLRAGADALILETGQDLMEWKGASRACREAMAAAGRRVPLVVQVTVDEKGRMLPGSSVGAFLSLALSLGADAAGFNCAVGPDSIAPHVAALCRRFPRPVSAMPNAGLPVMEGDRIVYRMTPAEFAGQVAALVEEQGAEIVGGCCGTDPGHIAALVERLATASPRRRAPRASLLVSSALEAVDLLEAPRPVIVGERLNSRGSRRFQRLCAEGKWDEITALAREQMEGGAALLDLSPAHEDPAKEVELGRRLGLLLSGAAAAPLVVDTVNRDLVEAFLASAAAVPVVSSVNLERGEEGLVAAARAPRDAGCPVVATCIDEQGMAGSAARKLEVAARIVDVLGERLGMEPARIIIDPLTFTLASGDEALRRAGIETLDALDGITRRLPGCLTVLGVSNISHGLPPRLRVVLDSVFHRRAAERGLDLAIVNPAGIAAWDRLPDALRERADDLVFDRGERALLRFVEAGEGEAGGTAPSAPASERPADPGEAVRQAVLRQDKAAIEGLVDRALEAMTPAEVLDRLLMPAMKEVGERMLAGRMILPHVVESAAVVQRALARLEPRLGGGAAAASGRTVVTATVRGDVHDIGKNIFSSLCRSFGFRVVDLGKQVPSQAVVDAVRRERPAAVGLSALLLSTAREAAEVSAHLCREGLSVPLLLGGAAMSEGTALRTACAGTGGLAYRGGVFHCRDAFDGLEKLRLLGGEDGGRALVDEENARLARALQGAPCAPVATAGGAGGTGGAAPGGEGAVGTTAADARKLEGKLDRRALYVKAWGVKPLTLGRDRALRLELDALFERVWGGAVAGRLVEPRAVYGLFDAAVSGETVTVKGRGGEARFAFGGGARPGGRTIARMLAGEGEEATARIALFVATVGGGVAREAARLHEAGEEREALLLHAVGGAAAEAWASIVHERAAEGLAGGAAGTKRFSPGYPLWRLIEEQEPIFRLLDPARIGVTLTGGWQMVPEHSVSAIVIPRR